LSRFILAFAIAAAGIGLAGAAEPAHGPEANPRPATHELTSSGSVASLVTLSRAMPRDDDEREQIRHKIRQAEPGTYIGEILRARDSSLARWPDSRGRAKRVWIQPLSGVEDWHARYVYEVHAAFVAWDTLQLPVHFVVVADSNNADIHVTFIDHFEEPISGRTRWARDENFWITDASIVLAVHHRTGEILEDDAMHAMALHEIGHLLGLDHTTDPSCVMAPKVRVRNLSDSDKATARLLYSLPAGQYSSR
jgi:predicted Zn-dependent protease